MTTRKEQRTAYEPCSMCAGSGMLLDPYSGEPHLCFYCKGDGTERARDAKGRFTTIPVHMEEAP